MFCNILYKEIKKFKMAVKMAAEILDLMYLSSAFRSNDKWSVDSYEIKDVEIKYEGNKQQLHIF